MLVLDTTPGAEQATDRIRPRDFGEDVRVGVLSARAPATLLQPLTADTKKVAAALQKAGFRVGATFGGRSVQQSQQLDLAGALSQAAVQLNGSSAPHKAIIVVFAGEDRNLLGAAARVRSALAASGARLFAVVTPRTAQQGVRPNIGDGMPSLTTTQVLADLAEESGGQIYRGAWTMKDLLTAATTP